MAVNVSIVDDSSSLRNVLKKTLEMSAFNVGRIFGASNGLETRG